jgi:hypothetical protein
MDSCPKDRPGGPLAVHAQGLGRSLSDLGYAAKTTEIHLRRLGALDGWLVEEHLGLDELTEPVLARFIGSGRAGGGKFPVTLRGLGPVLGFPAWCRGDPTGPCGGGESGRGCAGRLPRLSG